MSNWRNARWFSIAISIVGAPQKWVQRLRLDGFQRCHRVEGLAEVNDCYAKGHTPGPPQTMPPTW